MTYAEIIQSMSLRLAEEFEEIYHSAEIVSNDQNERQPAVALGDEWISLTPTDQKETIYIRRAGNDEVSHSAAIGSCVAAYVMRTPLRIVYFRDHSKNHGEIVRKLLSAILMQNVTLRSIIRDKWKLMKDENNGTFRMGAMTAYFGIDVTIMWDLLPSTCEQDFCIEPENPVKKCVTTINNS